MPSAYNPKAIHQKGASFPVRRMDFDFTGINKYFINNDPVPSMLWLAFQAYFPEGEAFFVDSVRDMRDQVKGELLQKNVSAFIGQEAMHGKEHYVANEEARRQGIDVSALDRATARVRRLGNKHLSKRFRLALTAAAEHFTGVISSQIAKRDDFRASIVDDRIKALILWHAMEETEHRAVAFDVYQSTGGGYFTRALAMTVVSIGITPTVLFGMIVCLRQDRQLSNLASWSRFLKSYWGSNGFFSELLPELLHYYRLDFHPNDLDAQVILHTLRSELCAEQ
ncbi:metal-dependent hydrolase [Paraperlucidibaca wandonensis]|jgi:predicted metal-dependent hydrolase|uniref:Metal-dependent hydrolase n=1 Tax=Paraperlucidibaca wandonensis TaxID=1268273 RepID=A0ABW3HGD3_9GAMM|nr:metal-dependent hydrolase [Paraperlucidibaca sp.]MBQ0842589.1 metal-dependent hydrolase [Paraperlucidibaca sp.]|tara:strand:- start:1479 stop:2321 length:843 start_codon:yes stop_codon:yes gene_type:complete